MTVRPRHLHTRRGMRAPGSAPSLRQAPWALGAPFFRNVVVPSSSETCTGHARAASCWTASACRRQRAITTIWFGSYPLYDIATPTCTADARAPLTEGAFHEKLPSL